MQKLTKKFLKAGYEILIRDVSYLGFPSYQILIPGFSELQQETDLKAKVYNTRAYLAQYLAYPERMRKREAKLLLGVLDYWADSPMENQMCQIYSIYPDCEFPAEDMRMGWQYLAAMCHVWMGDDKAAVRRMADIVRYAKIYQNKDLYFYLAVYHYLTMRDTGKLHQEAMLYLKRFFDEKVIERVDTIFEKREQVLIRQYPRCDYQGVYGDTRQLEGECGVWAAVRERLLEYQWKHQPEQIEIRNIFREITWKEEQKV